MKRKTKKSQVDVALTIGAVILPVAAIFGSLLFAFVVISTAADLGRLAAVISHDVMTISDITYSVPDNIKILYSPPSICTFAGPDKATISCMNGALTVPRITLDPILEDTKIRQTSNGKNECGQFPMRIETTLAAYFHDIPGWDESRNPHPFTYAGFVNIKDPISYSSKTFEIDNAVIIKKTRTSVFDTIDETQIYEDPLVAVVKNMLAACSTGKMHVEHYYMPRNFAFKLDGDSLALVKFTRSPVTVYDESLNPATGMPLGVNGWVTVSSVDLTQLDKFCNFHSSASRGVFSLNTKDGIDWASVTLYDQMNYNASRWQTVASCPGYYDDNSNLLGSCTVSLFGNIPLCSDGSGGCTLPDGSCTIDNCHQTGEVAYAVTTLLMETY